MSVQLIVCENPPGDTEADDLLLPPSKKKFASEQLRDLAVLLRALLESVLEEVLGWTLLLFPVVDISEMTVFIFVVMVNLVL